MVRKNDRKLAMIETIVPEGKIIDMEKIKIPALKVNQWLPSLWGDIQFTEGPPRSKPLPYFLIFSMKAPILKKLTGVYRRNPDKNPYDDYGIQRRHNPDRSKEILDYLKYGFPLSKIKPEKLAVQEERYSLQMPGWLPTSVVVNILTQEDIRGDQEKKVDGRDLVIVEPNDSTATIVLPSDCENENWSPRVIPPIEVIDGQHRLWALELLKQDNTEDHETRDGLNQMEIPVVAFFGLDITWQAYLFYTINQLAKKIDTSMVFDLYPLLRTQEWLLRYTGPNIYRETRAQELTLKLWSHEKSPWKDRILRLGGREKGKVTQAAYIRSLMASFIKDKKGTSIGGLYGAGLISTGETLPWTLTQQAAFLMYSWSALRQAFIDFADDKKTAENTFSGEQSLLSTDQGVRAFLCVLNDLLIVDYGLPGGLNFTSWNWEPNTDTQDDVEISRAFEFIQNDTSLDPMVKRIKDICDSIAGFDWRLASSIDRDRDRDKFHRQSSYRGSSGYKILQDEILFHIKNHSKENYITDLVDKLSSKTPPAEEE